MNKFQDRFKDYKVFYIYGLNSNVDGVIKILLKNNKIIL